MGQRYLLDTNTCLYFLNQALPESGFLIVSKAIDQAEVSLSVVTQMELLGFAFPSDEEETITKQFVSDMPVISLDDTIVLQTIAIRRKHRIKLPDAIIAATALVHNLILVTRNVSDFNSIEDLVVVDPFAG